MNRTEIRENTFKLLFCKEFHSKEEMGEQYKLYMESFENYFPFTRKINAVRRKITLQILIFHNLSIYA